MPNLIKREVNLIIPMTSNMELAGAQTTSSLAEIMGFEANDIDALQLALIEVAHEPTLFPLQPKAPIIPLILIAIGAYMLWRGAGAWSLDLRFSKARN